MNFLLLPLVKTNTLVVVIVALIIPLTSGYLVNSLTTAAPVAVQDCSCWDVAVSGSTCTRFLLISRHMSAFNSIIRRAIHSLIIELFCRDIV